MKFITDVRQHAEKKLNTRVCMHNYEHSPSHCIAFLQNLFNSVPYIQGLIGLTVSLALHFIQRIFLKTPSLFTVLYPHCAPINVKFGTEEVLHQTFPPLVVSLLPIEVHAVQAQCALCVLPL